MRNKSFFVTAYEGLRQRLDGSQIGLGFRDALGNELGFGMADRQPLSAEERDLERGFRRCVFENPKSQAALKIRRALQPFVAQIKKEDEYSSRSLNKRPRAR